MSSEYGEDQPMSRSSDSTVSSSAVAMCPSANIVQTKRSAAASTSSLDAPEASRPLIQDTSASNMAHTKPRSAVHGNGNWGSARAEARLDRRHELPKHLEPRGLLLVAGDPVEGRPGGVVARQHLGRGLHVERALLPVS